MYDLLHKKRMAQSLSEKEISYFVNGYTSGEIPDYQASALLMAIVCCGMDEEETLALTRAMMNSGDTVDLSRFGDLSVDKHSTGGVGDKTTLVLAPIVASLGGIVAKMSGRGLGHTGGTIDKLESIPGFNTTLSEPSFLEQVERVGVAVIGQSGNLAPADKKIYALRDVTATVDSIPLIASSIMSKKLAAGSHSIVLDVKVGSGAFMKNEEDARALAAEMVRIGTGCGRRVRACLSDMDLPLGFAIGNAREVSEAFAVLRGEGPDDLRKVCTTLAANMLTLSLGVGEKEAMRMVSSAIASGRALEKAAEWVAAQGGDARVLESDKYLPLAACERVILAKEDGYLSHMDAEGIGIAAMILGAGRMTKDDRIDPAAGITLVRKTGDSVKKGEPIARLHSNLAADRVDAAEERFRSALTFSQSAPPHRPLLLGMLE
jgi:pyrimidine-nucleoside phosphorylase